MAACSEAAEEPVLDVNVPTYEYIDVNTKAFHVGSFARLWREKLPPGLLSLDHRPEGAAEEAAEDAAFAEEMSIPADIVEEVKLVCSLDALKCHSENEPPNMDVVPEDSDLLTVRLRKRKQDYRESLAIDRTCRYDTYTSELECLAEGKRPADPRDSLTPGEIILSMNILYPLIFRKFKTHRRFQSIQVLGWQKLSALKDAICCVSDLQVSGEFSNTPDLAHEHVNKDHFKSSYFYFEGVLYDDMRFPECTELSQTVVEWARDHDSGHGELRTARMEDTTFNDLKIKIGFPYLYCHQGDCEHVLVFTDIRLAHRDDCLDKTLYPLLTKKHWLQTRKCSVCNMYIPRWVTSNDPFAPEDPCLFCETCFRMLHYDNHGHKLGDFLAYPYVDPGTFN